MPSVYIAVYICRKDKIVNDTLFYYEKYSGFLITIDCRGLEILLLISWKLLFQLAMSFASMN